MPIHDLRCQVCDSYTEKIAVVIGALPRCHCGGEQAITWEHGHAPATDVRGQLQYDRTGTITEGWTTERQREALMKEKGFERSPLADRHHGADGISAGGYKKPLPRVDPSLRRRITRGQAQREGRQGTDTVLRLPVR